MASSVLQAGGPDAFQRRVLITGASGALGKKMIEKFHVSGYQVIGTRSPFSQPSESLAESHCDKECKDLQWRTVDVTVPERVKELAKDVGRVDVLVHCAGGFRFSKTEDLKDDDIDFLVNTNLKSAMYLSREFLPVMKQQNFGRIIFISAKSTMQPGAGSYNSPV